MFTAWPLTCAQPGCGSKLCQVILHGTLSFRRTVLHHASPNLCLSLAPTSLLLQSTCFALYNAGLSVGKAIRGAETDKVPVMCVIGQREAAEGTVSVRTYADGDLGPMHVQELLSRLVAANTNKTSF